MVEAHGRERSPELIKMAGKHPVALPCPTGMKTERGYFGPSWSLLWWIWWLPMVVGVFGVVLKMAE